jgi:hypothetical protein
MLGELAAEGAAQCECELLIDPDQLLELVASQSPEIAVALCAHRGSSGSAGQRRQLTDHGSPARDTDDPPITDDVHATRPHDVRIVGLIALVK